MGLGGPAGLGGPGELGTPALVKFCSTSEFSTFSAVRGGLTSVFIHTNCCLVIARSVYEEFVIVYVKAVLEYISIYFMNAFQ